jgi:uncharacterized membrane protein YeaQ/YmgE (transglycosylase-associated protein family)
LCGVCDGDYFCNRISFKDVSTDRFVKERHRGTDPGAKAPLKSTNRREPTSIIGWIVLGLIAGFIASKIVGGSGRGIFLDITLGIVGALVGGFLYSAILGGPGVTGVNIGSIVVSIVGAIIVLWAYHAVAGRT